MTTFLTRILLLFCVLALVPALAEPPETEPTPVVLEATQNVEGLNERPTIQLGCRDGELEAVVALASDADAELAGTRRAFLRFGKGTLMKVESPDGRSFVVPSPRSFVRRMLDQERLLVRFDRAGLRPIVARFESEGFEEALSALSTGCTGEPDRGASSEPLIAGTGGVAVPKLSETSKVRPDYPELARVARIEGRVILQAIVLKDGSVAGIEVLDCNRPNLGFEEAAIAAVRQWRYDPARRDGEPVDVYFTIAVEFELRKSATADVVSVEVGGKAGAYEFKVGIRSPDTGCNQYANWWEVVSADGKLLTRRVLRHSHVEEQPFVRSGDPIDLDPAETVWIRAHMHPEGYGGQAMRGSIRDGFEVAKPAAGFAAGLERAPPVPTDCAF